MDIDTYGFHTQTAECIITFNDEKQRRHVKIQGLCDGLYQQQALERIKQVKKLTKQSKQIKKKKKKSAKNVAKTLECIKGFNKGNILKMISNMIDDLTQVNDLDDLERAFEEMDHTMEELNTMTKQDMIELCDHILLDVTNKVVRDTLIKHCASVQDIEM